MKQSNINFNLIKYNLISTYMDFHRIKSHKLQLFINEAKLLESTIYINCKFEDLLLLQLSRRIQKKTKMKKIIDSLRSNGLIDLLKVRYLQITLNKVTCFMYLMMNQKIIYKRNSPINLIEIKHEKALSNQSFYQNFPLK